MTSSQRQQVVVAALLFLALGVLVAVIFPSSEEKQVSLTHQFSDGVGNHISISDIALFTKACGKRSVVMRSLAGEDKVFCLESNGQFGPQVENKPEHIWIIGMMSKEVKDPCLRRARQLCSDAGFKRFSVLGGTFCINDDNLMTPIFNSTPCGNSQDFLFFQTSSELVPPIQ